MLEKLPFTHLRVGYQDIEVKLVDTGILGDDYGHYYRKKNYIACCQDQNIVEGVNTLIHEVLHAVWRQYDLDTAVDPKDRQEHTVNLLSNGLTQVFKDNPMFVKWIEESLANK